MSEENKKEDYVLQLEAELHELEKREESSTRRMQLLVYPSMVAFIILAAYGFYLVNSLTKDVHRMADSVSMMSDSVQKNMDVISENTTAMSDKMTFLVDNTRDMNANMTDLVGTTGKMSNSVDHLSTYTGNMQQDMWSLNRSISKPLNMFNKFIPWSNNSGSSQYRPPIYFSPQYRYQQQQATQQNTQRVYSAPSMPSIAQQPVFVPQQDLSDESNSVTPTPPNSTK
ncbi:MAG TPA: hypothetical protein ENJ33_07280 [Thiothrix sp.]|nr:hypothetical protein [Thiothrix sp.]